MEKLQKKVAVITGATSGMALATASYLSKKVLMFSSSARENKNLIKLWLSSGKT